MLPSGDAYMPKLTQCGKISQNFILLRPVYHSTCIFKTFYHKIFNFHRIFRQSHLIFYEEIHQLHNLSLSDNNSIKYANIETEPLFLLVKLKVILKSLVEFHYRKSSLQTCLQLMAHMLISLSLCLLYRMYWIT